MAVVRDGYIRQVSLIGQQPNQADALRIMYGVVVQARSGLPVGTTATTSTPCVAKVPAFCVIGQEKRGEDSSSPRFLPPFYPMEPLLYSVEQR